MSRLTRINTIWRKELMDTLRDRRTLIAMIAVPIVLYPAMLVVSLLGFQLSVSHVKQEEFQIAVPSERAARWLREEMLDKDAARKEAARGHPAEEVLEMEERGELDPEEEQQEGAGEPAGMESRIDRAQADVYLHPPKYRITVVPDRARLEHMVQTGEMHVGVLVGPRLPGAAGTGSAVVTIIKDQTEIRSRIAATGLEGVFDRAGVSWLRQRLEREGLSENFVRPIDVQEIEIASAEKVGGSVLGTVVPLILIIMTISGAIYPAIDLTAGERERGTLETLMVAPVPTVDLIAGKFVVVSMIAMISAVLNLVSIGGTIFLGGLGDLLTSGGAIEIPYAALPLVLLVLIPLAVTFSALLLAVCSFARSFKEAQNYIMPVMVAAMIPAVVGILPGTRLEGPLLVMPVTNIAILTRELFNGHFDLYAILWVSLSTTLYAGAAVAVAAKLFGQEAVLFADSGSIKTVFQRRFFKPRALPSAAQAFFLLAFVFSVNFFAQRKLIEVAPTIMWYWWGFAGLLLTLFALLPMATAMYTRVRISTAFALSSPPPLSVLAALCFGASTWILALHWEAFQSGWLPLPPETEQVLRAMESILRSMGLPMMLFFLALVPAICEELFFRGYALSGLRSGLGKAGAVLVVAAAFAFYHGMVQRLVITGALGILLGMLVIQFRAVWPAMLAHLMHNGSMVAFTDESIHQKLTDLGLLNPQGVPAVWATVAAAALTLAGIGLCIWGPRRSAVAACPACGQQLPPGAAGRCPHCGAEGAPAGADYPPDAPRDEASAASQTGRA
jgi:sodium transport system permease protein